MKSFKKFIYLLFCLPLIFFSCSKDDDKKQDEPPIVTHEFKYIESSLNDFYTTDQFPLSIDLNNNKIYIGDRDKNIAIFDADYTYLGDLKNRYGVKIEASIVRFKKDDGFFIYHPKFNYLRCYSAIGKREAEINNLPELFNNSINPIFIDRQDRLFLVYDNHTIKRYNPDLTGPVASTVNIGSLFEHGEYGYTIMDICTDKFNKVYISIDVEDTQGEGYDVVIKFDNDLNFISVLGGNWIFNGPHGIAFDDANYMYVVNRFHHVVKVFDTDQNLVTMSWENLDDPGSTGGQLNQPIGIRIKDNKVYVTEKENHCVTVYTTYN
jgi:hypothetical protein